MCWWLLITELAKYVNTIERFLSLKGLDYLNLVTGMGVWEKEMVAIVNWENKKPNKKV